MIREGRRRDQISSHIKYIIPLLFLVMGICGATAVEQPVITGEFMPSGVYSHGYAYKIYVKSWVNYCPACHKYHALLYNPKGVYEGELTCKYCGADFDGVTGYEKLYHPRWRLTPVYYKNGKAVVYAGYLRKKYKKI